MYVNAGGSTETEKEPENGGTREVHVAGVVPGIVLFKSRFN